MILAKGAKTFRKTANPKARQISRAQRQPRPSDENYTGEET